MKKFIRKCPKCGKNLEYTILGNKNEAEKNNRPCRSCSAKNRYLKFGSYIDIINKEIKLGIRENGFKNKKHSKETINKIIENKNYSTYKTKEFKDKMRIISSGENNPMYGKKVFDIWIEKYGIDEANKREKLRREKLSKLSSGINNSMYGKETPKKAGKGISGHYKNFYFRSLHELKFILIMERFSFKIVSVENIRIKYLSYTGSERTYSPDFMINDKYLIEVKPKKLQNTPLNLLKFNAAKRYCENNNLIFKIIDLGIILQKDLDILIKHKLVILN